MNESNSCEGFSEAPSIRHMSTSEPKNLRLQEEIEKWTQITKKYGDFVVVEEPVDIKGIDPKRVWTEVWTGDQVISNRLIEVEEFDSDITSYYVFEKAYSEREGSLVLVTTIWEDCDCDGNEDCPKCEGEGSLAIDVV